MKKSKTKLKSGMWEARASRNMDFLKTSLFTSSLIKPLKKVLGAGYDIRVSVGGKNYVSCYVKTLDIEKLGKIVRKKFLNNPAAFKKFLEGYYQSVQRLFKIVKRIGSVDYKKLTDKELINLIQGYFNDFTAMCSFGSIGNRLAAVAMEPIIKKHLVARNYQGSFNEALNKLILPSKVTYIFQEEQSLLEIAKFISQRQNLKNEVLKILKQQLKFSLDKLFQINQVLERKIKNHLKKFSWVLIAIYHERWQNKFAIKLRVLLQLNSSILVKKVVEHQQSWNKLKVNQQKLIKRIRPTPQVKRAIKLMGEFIALKDHFGHFNRYIPEEVKPLLKEAAKRLRLTYQDIIYLTADEIIGSLLKRRSFKKDIIARQKYYVLIDNSKGCKVLTGNKARKFVQKNIKLEEVPEEQKALFGQIASRGKARGVAKVVFRISDLNIVKQGDVLISPNTTTEMIRAIKKACAIVTDEGGLGSHAAIVSREFSIPCIVGTRMGTRFFKTGDFIEVDADKGIVKKYDY